MLIVAFGTLARFARASIEQLRAEGLKVGCSGRSRSGLFLRPRSPAPRRAVASSPASSRTRAR